MADVRREQADAARGAFFDSLATELQRWLPKYVGDEITDRSRQVTIRSPGQAKRLPAIKKGLKDIVDKLPKLVPAWYGAPFRWPSPLCQQSTESTTAPDRLDAPLQTGLEKLLRPLMKGYVLQDNFSHDFKWSPAINAFFNAYCVAQEAHDKAKNDLTAAVREQEVREASLLWDNA